MEDLIGRVFLNNKMEEVNPEEVLNCKLIALLFTASWCSPCVIFEKELIELYSEANIGDKMLEIVHISSDRTEEAFKKSLGNKPWVFLPYHSNKIGELVSKYSVLAVPVFLVLRSSDCQIVTETGRKELSEEGVKVIDRWLSQVS